MRAGWCCCSGLGQFSVPLLLGRRESINVLTTEMYLLREHYPIDYGLAAMLGIPLVIVGILVIVAQWRALGDTRRFVTVSGRGGNLTRSTGSRWTYVPVSLFGIFLILAPLLALTYVGLQIALWSVPARAVRPHDASRARGLRRPAHSRGDLPRSIPTQRGGLLIVIPIGFFAAVGFAGSHLGAAAAARPGGADRDGPARHSRRGFFGFGILFAYTVEPFSLFNSELVIVIVVRHDHAALRHSIHRRERS